MNNFCRISVISLLAIICGLSHPVSAQPAGGSPTVLKVSSDPPGARITIDGRDWRRITPAVISGLNPGAHLVKVSKPPCFIIG